MKFTAALAAIFAITLAISAGSPGIASETPPPLPPDTTTEPAPVKPLDATLVIDGSPTDIAVMPDFDPHAPAVVLDSSGSPVSVSDVALVQADGESIEVPTIDTTSRSALAGCSWYSWVAPGTGTWYSSVNGCSFIGLTAATEVGYSWTVDSNSVGSACLKGRGYQYLTWPGGGGYSEFYGPIGCGSGGSAGGDSLPWGNVASTKRLQMISYSTPAGAAGMFQ